MGWVVVGEDGCRGGQWWVEMGVGVGVWELGELRELGEPKA